MAYADLRFLRRNMVSVAISALVVPTLYLVAFGFGMRGGSADEIAFMIPGIVAISSLTSGFSSSSQKIMIQRLFHSSFDELVISPMSTSAVVLGKTAIGVIRGMLGGAITVCMGLLLTEGMSIGIGFIASMLLSCATFSTMGVMAGLLARSTQNLAAMNSLLVLPMTFLCGTLFRLDDLPQPMADILYILPLSHSSICLRASAAGGDAATILISAAALSLYLLSFFLVCRWILKEGKYRS